MNRVLIKLSASILAGILTVSMSFPSFAYDPQYPLKGQIEDNFMLSASYTDASCSPESRFYTSVWKWDPSYYMNEVNWKQEKAMDAAFWTAQEERKASGTGYIDWFYDYALDCAIRDSNPNYLMYFSGIDMAVLADLAGYSLTNYDFVDAAKKEQLTQSIREFLNFYSDWDTASDIQKVSRICERITRADYDYEGDAYKCNTPYACLVEGKTMCGGYTAAAELLGACVGIPVSSQGSIGHAYPVFLADGVWLRYEPTSKDANLWIADVYTPAYALEGIDNGEPQLFQIGKYCKGTGYVVPQDITDKFAPISTGIRHGEPVQFVRFLNPNSPEYDYMKENWQGYLQYENPKGLIVPKSPFE